MAAGIDPKKLRRKVRELTKKWGEPVRVLRASNGEVAIVSESWYRAMNRKG